MRGAGERVETLPSARHKSNCGAVYVLSQVCLETETKKIGDRRALAEDRCSRGSITR